MAIPTKRMPEPDSDDIMQSADPAIINDGNLQFMSDGRRDESTASSILGPQIAGFVFKSDSDTQGQDDDDLLIKKVIATYRAKNSKTAFGHGYLGSTSHLRQAQKIPRIHNAETISKDNTKGHEARMSKLCADLAPKIFHRQRPGSSILLNHRPSFARGSRLIEGTRTTGQRTYDGIEATSTTQGIVPARRIPVRTYNEPSLLVSQGKPSPANETAANVRSIMLSSDLGLNTPNAQRFQKYMNMVTAAQRNSGELNTGDIQGVPGFMPPDPGPEQKPGSGSLSLEELWKTPSELLEYARAINWLKAPRAE
ncbi:hypothetical protein S7711_10649 [Stachybotrys chartarum IBT 7711]|uniref:Uncharacterized protein n=1 Tax=Stachybotrys chartarum (strain CBS 109288 / IBT 7711) TaxID=1280523 RepID=A0A084B2F3_STACB|nr:hypothetical protein S7711_10649 [Stachybotrys chartarum IBT 7711]